MQNKRSKKLEVLLQFTIYNLRFGAGGSTKTRREEMISE